MNQKRKKYCDNNPKFKKSKMKGAHSSNRFEVLSDLDESDAIRLQSEEYTEPIIKVPPIIIDNCHNFNSILQLLGQKCKYKRMSIGTKVMPSSVSDFEDHQITTIHEIQFF